MMRNPAIQELADRAGIVFDSAMEFLPRLKTASGDFGSIDRPKLQMALDAAYTQPGLVTTPDGGILSLLTTFIDPKLIKVLLSPMNGEEIYGSRKIGDFSMSTTAFSMIEYTGQVAAYADFNENGMSGVNAQWPQRQAFNYQTITEWGDLEVERMGLAKIDLVSQKNLSSANTLTRFGNLMAFYGISGLQNYGGLNDPSLSASLTPATKAAGGTSWANALPTEILADVQAQFATIQTQTGGNVTLDMPMTLGIHPTTDVYLVNTNSFGLTAAEMLEKAFPKLKVKTAVQYLSGSTYSTQLIVDELEGQRTTEFAFNERMRAGRIVTGLSSFRQKKSAGGWGTVVYRPICIATMAGV